MKGSDKAGVVNGVMGLVYGWECGMGMCEKLTKGQVDMCAKGRGCMKGVLERKGLYRSSDGRDGASIRLAKGCV